MTQLHIHQSRALKLSPEERFEITLRDVLRRIRLRPPRDGRTNCGTPVYRNERDWRNG